MIQTDYNFFAPAKKAGLYLTFDYRRSGKILSRWGVLWAIIFSLVWSCSDAEPPASVGGRPDRNLRLVIKWPGDDMASKQDLELRNKIEQNIVKRRIGKIVRSGTGMGWMDIVFEVNVPEKARPEIEAVIKEIAPKLKFEIQAE
jgi:hypothetical protein